jgi:hypothetical protein
MSKHQQIASLINRLTLDEDLRQDLWVAYLSGTPNNSLTIVLDSISSFNHIEDNFKQQIQSLISNPPSIQHPPHFSDLECIIVCLLILGCDLSIISRYNGISEVKVRQVVVALQEGKYGFKEKFER